MDFFATALPALGDAFSLILAPENLMYLVIGVVLGLSIGVFPGLGGIAGLSMLLPFIYGMDPVAGLALMVGLVAVIPTSDTFASVLMGIPGSSASQATVLDGFPLAKKGQAARALSAAFTSSLFGGLFGAAILTVFVLIARPIVLAFGIPELLLLTLFGLSMVGVLAGTSLLKGLIAAGLGMMIGAIGEAPAQGSPRMDMETWYLQDGLALVIVGLGIFAIPEIITLLRQDKPIAKGAVLGNGWRQGMQDWWLNKWLSLRCSFLGVVIGVIPGLGGSVVDWIAYGHTVQTVKDTSDFGKGDIRGVIGPESSNNAKEGGGLVPTLLFGIPGSGSMAVFIGGLILLGYEAGPQMITNDLDITYTIVWSLALANVVGAGLCIFLSGGIARLTAIPFPTLAPFLFMMIAFAAFQSKQTPWDLVALIGVGILGLYMRRFEWPRPAFLIGFVLADQAEVYTYQVTQIANVRLKLKGMEGLMDYLISTTGIILLVIIVVSVYLGAKNKFKLSSVAAEQSTGSKRGPMIFTLMLMAFGALYLQQVIAINIIIDKVFPVTMACITLFFGAVLLLRMRMLPETASIFADTERGEDLNATRTMWATLAWFIGLLAGTLITGFIIALTVFMLVFFRLRAGLSWYRSSALTVMSLTILLIIAGALNRDFPGGLLQEMFKLPWPFT
ncbi:MAG: tripartite tricarboxylate transporter permease [Gammaproteobacteria bacterium]|nr:tripartite tricarboxylate transporter permease [Gammaproteobacteria bacterium]